MRKRYPEGLYSWVRRASLFAGVIAVLVGIVIILFPGLALLVVVYLVGVVLVLIGIDRIIFALSGRHR